MDEKKSLQSFKAFTDEESRAYLADHYPKGRLFSKRNLPGSYIYKLIKSLSEFVKIISGEIYTVIKNRDLSKADELLEEWETSVKIPEEIPRRDTIEGQRAAVQCLISKIPVYNINCDSCDDVNTTIENYIYCMSGLEVSIETGGSGSVFPARFPIVFGAGSALGTFLFIIKVPVEGEEASNTFPMVFPTTFFTPSIPESTEILLNNLLDRVIPSWGYWIFEVDVI